MEEYVNNDEIKFILSHTSKYTVIIRQEEYILIDGCRLFEHIQNCVEDFLECDEDECTCDEEEVDSKEDLIEYILDLESKLEDFERHIFQRIDILEKEFNK